MSKWQVHTHTELHNLTQDILAGHNLNSSS